MKTIQRILTGMGGLLVVAIVLQLCAPRAVHSTVAALVSVVGNVAVTNPVDSTGNPQLLAVRSGAKPFFYFGSCINNMELQCVVVIPLGIGQTVQLRDISGSCTTYPGYLETISLDSKLSSIQVPPTFSSAEKDQFNNPIVQYIFGREVDLTISASDAYEFHEYAGPQDQASCYFTLAGYYITE